MGESTGLILAAVCFLAIGGALLLFAPKLMILLAWPVILCYPQQLFYGLLPANAGLDDVFIILLAIRMLLPHGGYQIPHWARSAVLLAIGLALVEAIGEYTGSLQYSFLLSGAVKRGLKAFVLALFTLAMALDIRTERDVYRHLIAFGLAVTAAFTLVIACFFRPDLSRHWEIAREDVAEYREVTVTKRAFGAFGGPAEAGIAVCATVPVALGLLIYRPRRRFLTTLALLMLATSLTALLLCKTRAGMLGLAGMFMTMTFLSKQRKYAILLEVIGIVVITGFLAGGEVLGAAEERLDAQKLIHDAGTRLNIWLLTIDNATPWILFCGEGFSAGFVRLGQSPHNGYLDIIFLWGLGGVVMFSFLIWYAVKWSSLVERADPSSCCRAAAWGFKWGLVAIAFLAMVSDPWYTTGYRLMVYFFLVIVGVRYRTLRAAGATTIIGQRPPAAGPPGSPPNPLRASVPRT